MKQSTTIITDNNIQTRFDVYSGAFLVTNIRSQIVYVNNAMVHKTGYSKSDMMGKRPDLLWGGNMAKVFYADMWHTLGERAVPFVGEVINIKKDGTLYKDRLHIAPVFLFHNKAQYFLQIYPDFSRRKLEDRSRFTKEFLHIFSRQGYYKSSIFAWIMGWLSNPFELEKKDAELAEYILKKYDTFGNALVGECGLNKSLSVKKKSDKMLEYRVSALGKKFPLIYRLYCDKIYQYFLYRLNFNKVLAEDLLQETFCRAFSYVSSFRPTSRASYATYLFRIAHNLLVNYYRKKKPLQYDDFNENLLSFIPDYEAESMKEVLWVQVDSLSKIERQVIIMKYRHQLLVREIAVALGKTENAVKLHLSRARKKLKKIMGETNK